MPFAVQAWETWLSEHLVQAMVNYPEAVMLGNTDISVIVNTIFIVVTIGFFLSLSVCRYRLKHWTSQSHSGSNGARGDHLLYHDTAKDLR